MLKPLKPLGELRQLKALITEPLVSTLPTHSDDPEEQAKLDHIHMMKGLRQQQAEANETANAADYWFAVYFQTTEQKEMFLKAVGVVSGGQYVDGEELAQALKIKLTPRTVKYKTGTLDTKCAALARKPFSTDD